MNTLSYKTISANKATVNKEWVVVDATDLVVGRLTIYGGGWAAHFVSPAGLENAPLVSDPENQNLVPNQSLLTAPQNITLAPGDWIFLHPKQSDALFQFEEIMLVRGGRLQEERWRAFPRRY